MTKAERVELNTLRIEVEVYRKLAAMNVALAFEMVEIVRTEPEMEGRPPEGLKDIAHILIEVVRVTKNNILVRMNEAINKSISG